MGSHKKHVRKYFCCLRSNDGNGKMEFQGLPDSCEVVQSTETKRRGHHYLINVRCSYSEEGRTVHTTEKGRLFVRLTGRKAQSPVLEAKKDYVQFFPGSTIEFLVSTTQMGRLLRLDLEWRSTASLLNPLTWRLFNVPQIYIRDIIVTHLETGERVVFCGRDEALIPHKIRTIFANQSCARQPPPFMEDKKKKQDLDSMSSHLKPRFYSDR
ncbi:hypothetical protein AVEN_98997-1 [Araneus ventricosus]|uniref:Uncharacterized protein n=1 Tax=Araneus ventricosus TaxID=182803 RepID=A0A4Y2G793_ARAVE|nr:hypothetical protein AVEN_98997-1 [Araneus ventricosus]